MPGAAACRSAISSSTDAAERIHAILEKETPWGVAYNEGTRVVQLSAAQARRTDRRSNASASAQSINERARHGYQFFYYFFPMLEASMTEGYPAMPLFDVLRFLNGDDFLGSCAPHRIRQHPLGRCARDAVSRRSFPQVPHRRKAVGPARLRVRPQLHQGLGTRLGRLSAVLQRPVTTSRKDCDRCSTRSIFSPCLPIIPSRRSRPMRRAAVTRSPAGSAPTRRRCGGAESSPPSRHGGLRCTIAENRVTNSSCTRRRRRPAAACCRATDGGSADALVVATRTDSGGSPAWR